MVITSTQAPSKSNLNPPFSLSFLYAILFESELSNRGLPQMEETKAKKSGGKREGQKYKSLLVWDILLKKKSVPESLKKGIKRTSPRKEKNFAKEK